MTMYYQLTEAELHDLDIARAQAALMAQAMDCSGGKATVPMVDVARFLDGVVDKIRPVLAAVEERDVCRGGVPPQLLAEVLRMASGEDLGAAGFQSLNDQLALAMADDPAYAVAIRPFYDVLMQRGYQITLETGKPAISAGSRRSRSHLVLEKTVSKTVGRSSRRRDNLVKTSEADKATA